MSPDHHAINLGGACHGDPASPVRLAPDWRGAPPPRTAARIAGRRDVDLAPLSPHDPADRTRLLAFIWADQPERLARLIRPKSSADAAHGKLWRPCPYCIVLWPCLQR